MEIYTIYWIFLLNILCQIFFLNSKIVENLVTLFLYSPASKLEASNSAGNLILQTFLEWVFFNYRSNQDYFTSRIDAALAQELRNSKIHFQYTCYHQIYRWWNLKSLFFTVSWKNSIHKIFTKKFLLWFSTSLDEFGQDWLK